MPMGGASVSPDEIVRCSVARRSAQLDVRPIRADAATKSLPSLGSTRDRLLLPRRPSAAVGAGRAARRSAALRGTTACTRRAAAPRAAACGDGREAHRAVRGRRAAGRGDPALRVLRRRRRRGVLVPLARGARAPAARRERRRRPRGRQIVRLRLGAQRVSAARQLARAERDDQLRVRPPFGGGALAARARGPRQLQLLLVPPPEGRHPVHLVAGARCLRACAPRRSRRRHRPRAVAPPARRLPQIRRPVARDGAGRRAVHLAGGARRGAGE